MQKTRTLLLALCIWLCCSGYVLAQESMVDESGEVRLTWDTNDESDLAGYRVYTGSSPNVYDTMMDVGNTTSHTVTGLIVGAKYFIVVTAYDVSNNESGYSDEIKATGRDYTPPDNPSGLIEEIQITTVNITVNTLNIINGDK